METKTQTKNDLIKKGKEMGLNLKSSMTKYEMQARIKEAEEAAAKAKKEETKQKSKRGGEY